MLAKDASGAIKISEPTVPGEVIQYSDYALDTSSPFAGGAAWVDGEYVPVEQARMSIMDSGFAHSDVTYTVAHVWHGNMFRLSDHLDRLLSGAEKMRITSPLSKDEIAAIATECVVKSQLREAYVSVSLTRGIGALIGEDSANGVVPQVYIYVTPYQWRFPALEQISGSTAIIPLKTRRAGRNTIDPQIKNYQWGDLIQAQFEAVDRGARTPLLLDQEGYLAEGPGYNVIVVKDGVLATPHRNALPGITRRTALEIAEAKGLPTSLRDVTVSELYDADEIFATTTGGGITPIIQLDGKPVGDGQPGPITIAIRTRYWELMDEPSDLIQPVTYR